MSERNIGGSRLSVKVEGIDEALAKLDQLIELLNKANALKNELACTEITIQFPPQVGGFEQED
ncbi:hypothetical protein HRF87_00660 [Bacillus sp. CRN 9]|nr:hypothetical protein [Bacillus sp. CRN 9]